MDTMKEESDLIYAIVFFLIFISGSVLIAREEKRKNFLKKIIKGIEEVGKGNFDYEIKIDSRGGLGKVVLLFNEMARQLKQTKTASEETKAALEIKLLARTEELEELAESREDIIEKRTKELLERLEELEKFHRLAVGRELKMIELKKELKELEARVKKQKLWKKK